MAEEERGFTLSAGALARISKAVRWYEQEMGGYAEDYEYSGDEDYEGPRPVYVRITGNPATGADTTYAIYPAKYVVLPGTGGTGLWTDLDGGDCYARSPDSVPLVVSSGSGSGPVYMGQVYTGRPGTTGTGALVVVASHAPGCTAGTSPTGATCETSCEHTLVFDQCNGAVLTRTTLNMFLGVPAKFCVTQSTGPAPPCPPGPTGPTGASGAKREIRAVPTVVGESILIGRTDLGSILDVSINGGTAFQGSKLYTVAHSYDTSNPTGWYEVRPVTSFLPYGAGHDFAVDVQQNGSQQTYRLRRVAGTTAGTASVDIYTGGTLTTLSSTGATAISGYAPNMLITQIGTNVAIGKNSTDPPTSLLDLGTAGVAASGGINLNTDSSNAGPRNVRWVRSGSTRFDVNYDGISDRLYFTNGSTVFAYLDRTLTTFNVSVAFTSAGTAAFAARATFGHSLVVDSFSGANPVVINQAENVAATALLSVKPLSGNTVGHVEVQPSGTQDLTQLGLLNAADRANSGSLRISVDGNLAEVSSATLGTGTPVASLTVSLATVYNASLTCTASASFQAPVAFASSGTATFASRAVFNNSLTLESSGGANPLVMSQAGPTSGFSILKLQPSTGNAIGGYWVAPSGTETSTLVRYFNTSDTANAGYFQVTTASVVTYSALANGSGTAPTRLDMTFPMTFTSTGTATFASRVVATRSLSLESASGASPMLFSQVSPIGAICILQLNPVTVDSQPVVQTLPSGTAAGSTLRLGNVSDPANAGFLSLNNGATTASIDGTITGSGTAPSRLDITLPTKLTSTVGFNNTNPIAKPTITGSRGGNAALAALLTALANYGLIIDSTS